MTLKVDESVPATKANTPEISLVLVASLTLTATSVAADVAVLILTSNVNSELAGMSPK